MANTDNPYGPPEATETDAEISSSPRLPHGLLLLQAAVATLFVSVGISESHPSFRWAMFLIPPPPFSILLPVIPFILPSIIYQLSVEKKVPVITKITAVFFSIVLGLVSLWGLLPLVQ